ncbi:MAG: YIP1 family protein [Lachnospiraceae bacterium]|nr:YIP1 family protein [Lachnospiraceae bacterium]
MKRSGFQTMSPYVYPFYTMLHPKDGFQEMKMNHKDSVPVTILLVAAYIVVDILYRIFVDFDLNGYNAEKVSAPRVAVTLVAVFFIVTAANWCFCTLLDGKGKFREICYVAACAILPMILMNLIVIILSRFLTIDESVIITYPAIVVKCWSLLLFAVGLSEIHDYSGKKTVFSLILTVVGIVAILFLGMITVMLFRQLYYFIVSVIFEIKYS